MKPLLWMLSSCAFALSFSSCGNSSGGGNPQATTGPFDKNGNYVEEWADNPSKWRKGGGTPSPHESRSDVLPDIAKNDQPPQNSVPLASAEPAATFRPTSKPAPAIAQTQVTKSKSTTTKPNEVVVRTRPLEKPTTVSTTKSKSKPKPVLVKAKAKPKPKSTRYVVKSGDSLSTIASRTGSSVSAIKSENGISGTMIRPGQSLVIPKR